MGGAEGQEGEGQVKSKGGWGRGTGGGGASKEREVGRTEGKKGVDHHTHTAFITHS